MDKELYIRGYKGFSNGKVALQITKQEGFEDFKKFKTIEGFRGCNKDFNIMQVSLPELSDYGFYLRGDAPEHDFKIFEASSRQVELLIETLREYAKHLRPSSTLQSGGCLQIEKPGTTIDETIFYNTGNDQSFSGAELANLIKNKECGYEVRSNFNDPNTLAFFINLRKRGRNEQQIHNC